MAKRTILLAPDAVRQLKQFRAADRARLKEAMQAGLAEDDAVSSRNRFPLRRPSEAAGFELRVGELRVFYRVVGSEVRITMIGRKIGNQLLIDGERFTL